MGPGRQGVKGGEDERKQPLGFSVGRENVIKKIDLGWRHGSVCEEHGVNRNT